MDDDFFLLKIPHRLNFSCSEGAFSYIGPRLWNGLLFDFRSLNTLDVFKKSLKSYFFNIPFKNVVDNSTSTIDICNRKGHTYITMFF